MGLDPSLRATGWIVIDTDGLKALGWGIIKTKGNLKGSLVKIRDNLRDIIKEFSPDKAVMEAIIYHRNPKVAIMLGAVRGVILLTLEDLGIEVIELQPTKIKLGTTRYGLASKEQVANVLRNVFSLPEVEDHITDALAAAYYLVR
ncbi:MAG: crossover junction endodeoxyribonuclease RuvC [candidate division WOR-3 bacterium]